MQAAINKKAGGAIFFLAVLFFFIFTSTFAYAETMLEITSQTVNIRSGPATAYDKIASANKGDTFRVVQEKDGWYEIVLADKSFGWVISTYVKIVTNDKLPQYIKITAGIVNIRSGPGTGYDKVGEMQSGTKYGVTGEDGDWYKISLSDAKSGYVAKWLVEVTYAAEAGGSGGAAPVAVSLPDGYKQGLVNTDTLNLRTAAGTDAPKVAALNKNTRIAIYERSGDWYSVITESGQKGWVACQYIDLDDTFLSSSQAEEPGLPVWSGSGDPYGQIELSWKEKNNSLYIYLESEDVIVYKLSDSGNKAEINTDMELSGELPQNDGLSAAISGKTDNILKITYSKGMHYAKEFSADGKKLTLKFTSSPLSGKIIYLDPGHGCYNAAGTYDTGATGPSGLRECDVVYGIALKTQAILESLGADVRMTRGEKGYVGLEERAWMANAANADIFVSIHANSSTSSAVSGTSTWFYAPASDSGYDRVKRQLLAQVVQEALLEAGGRANSGIREDRFVVLRETEMPSILIETAFISNAAEESLLKTDSFQAALAQGIAEGIKNYFAQTD